ncbi:hypothetical protein [Runella sp.]|uniref:hypothetical protein n=1 Tax=Runella sp. TaxID=1960881 RepID=UPI003D0B81CE
MNYITNTKGKRISVVLPMKEYERLLADSEELEDIKLYDQVKAKKEETVLLEDYLKQRQLKK